jgi:hypothetical protein
MAKPASAPPVPNILTLPPNTIFKVEVVPPAKPPDAWDQWRPIVKWLLVAVLIVSGVLYLFWIMPMAYSPVLADDRAPGLLLTVSYPVFLARGDEGAIEVTATNANTQPLTGTVTVIFSGTLPVQFVGDSGNTLKIAALPAGGQQTLHVRYQLAQIAAFGSDSLRFTPHALLENGASVDYAPQNVTITFVPLVKTILTGALGISAITGLLWAQLKQRLFPAG